MTSLRAQRRHRQWSSSVVVRGMAWAIAEDLQGSFYITFLFIGKVFQSSAEQQSKAEQGRAIQHRELDIGSVVTLEPLVQWPFGWGYQTGGRARFDIRQRGSRHNKFENALQPLAVPKLKTGTIKPG
ncbi:hypothetical protein FVEG_15017 [Fusarium verticillioides 7600]|uniref:Uncharacterized protein n=1 Tax=Gibberella moniliformis (strain M3125 / FGSC 7600) TaxID=334819 RepID=W7LVQ8_GIBM7|nr:hypothetical protein FVEG_15017 [Fusarium verticillioides 7600]EWG39494.1 hypothetical protein FVEG_15017 [Fusarium verticillioides 7600]